MHRSIGKRTWLQMLSVLCVLVMCAAMMPAASVRAQGQTVRVGYYLQENFQEGKPGEVKTGYGYEYLQMVRNYTGWTYEYVYGEKEELQAMLARGEIDLMSHMARTDSREQTMLFGMEPQGHENHYLYVCAEHDKIDGNDPATLNGKRVGSLAGDFRRVKFEKWCQEMGVVCDIVEYEDAEQMHADLHDGKLDAISESRIDIAAHPGDWKTAIRFDDAPVYFAVSKTRPDLLEELDAAQAEILNLDEYYGEKLQQKYKGNNAVLGKALTEEEKAWLETRGTIRVGYCDERRPLAYKDENGRLAGLLADYLSAMTEAYGIQFETYAYQGGIALLDGLTRGEVDVIAPVGYHFGMAENGGVSISNAITVEAMLAVFKGYEGTERKNIYRRIAVLENSVTEKDYARRYYPDAVLVEAKDIAQALKFVESGVVDCYMIRSSTYAWYKNEYDLLQELQFANLPDANDVNMAVRTEDVELLPILNKGIALLDATDVTQSVVAHSAVREADTWLRQLVDDPLLLTAVCVAALLVTGLIFVLYRLWTEKKYIHRLEQAKKEADVARAEADRANMAKSTFLTSMSHDIRTPMNAIIGMTTLASKHLHNPDYVRNCLGKVTLASDHLLTLINDVLDINKIETGNLSMNPVVFSLADSIMNLTNIGRHQLQEKNHRFEIRIHNIKQEFLFADELRINQVFINLLSNAVKYTPTGGCITIDVKEEAVPGERGKVRLIYEIKDTGIGMSEEFQAHMYELFAMANRNDGAMTGSGVGLAICKQLIDLMGGTIECDSHVGLGTKFTVTLDIPMADRVVDELVLPPMKLLLVDDDEVFLSTAAETLRDLGLSPDCVDSGAKAVAVVEQKRAAGKDYPLIIIDWKMPGMDGLETTRAIRQMVGPEVSIIVISAYAPEEIRDAAIAAGANGFINKPFFRSFAYHSISEVLGLDTTKTEELTRRHKNVEGMRLLVAEDNDLNWEIARELLAMYHIVADRADNGQACLEMLEEAPAGKYDAVLMDIQMPVMNGYQASRAIRVHKRPDLRALPVVAMTADAYTEDVLRCAEAGMNAHIPKPIDMDRLLDVLGDLREA